MFSQIIAAQQRSALKTDQGVLRRERENCVKNMRRLSAVPLRLLSTPLSACKITAFNYILQVISKLSTQKEHRIYGRCAVILRLFCGATIYNRLKINALSI
jgi:hypothetical protein